MSPLAVHARGLHRSFDGSVAVDTVDLDVEAGEIYGFLGPNGAGKSTCVRMLCTLLRPTRGVATVAGHDVVAEPTEVRRRIGVALQEASLDDKLTGRQMLAHQGQLYGISRRRISLRIAQLSSLVDTSALDRPIGTYSGGMKRRLDLAAALIHEPELVFFDEPTTGLDPDSRLRVWDEIRRINAETGSTVFLTTQYLDEADELAGRLGILRAGRVAVEGRPADLKARIGGDVIEVRVDAPPDHAVETVAAVTGVESVVVADGEVVVRAPDAATVVGRVAVALDRAGMSIENLRLHSPSLDDVYFAVTGERFDEDEQ